MILLIDSYVFLLIDSSGSQMNQSKESQLFARYIFSIYLDYLFLFQSPMNNGLVARKQAYSNEKSIRVSSFQ